MSKELTASQQAIKDEIVGKLSRHFGRTLEDATPMHIYKAAALTVRDTIVERWTAYRREQRKIQNKELFYLSFEFLMGRALGNNLLNIGLTDDYEAVLQSMGCSLAEISAQEKDAGLGNGGLGRLAACFIDSLTTLNLPAFGCSIRYEYGLFRQKIVDGEQVEMYDEWLKDGDVWEIARPEEQQTVHFGGKINMIAGSDGRMHPEYVGSTDVIGIPYDMPIAGYDAKIVNTLRLWSAKAKTDTVSDFDTFSTLDPVQASIKASEEQAMAEAISKVLYPEDSNQEGKELRLRQQYFFVSCTIQWILSRFKRHHGPDVSRLADYVAIHINDTHPAIAIPELMRVLMDQEGMGWDQAWEICQKVFAYTNHTILSEALEKWPQELVQRMLPRIWMILEEMNRRLTEKLIVAYGYDWGKINYMQIIAYDYVNMANLCLACCHKVNGVSVLHTDILEKEVFNDYYKLSPNKFTAITNGITYRRWLRLANPQLSKLITETIGEGWEKNPELLDKLTPYADDAEFRRKFQAVKLEKKKELAAYIKEQNGIDVDPNSIFDVHVKRLHEYKRQLLNILHIMYLYDKLKKNPDLDIVPHTFIFGAKAARAYKRAKLIIKLINDVANVVNNDPDIKGKIKVVFIENYGVSLAQMIIPAAEISEQISTAGLEASGTGNMKFMANGALTCGTMDGANVEMSQCVGKENMFIFGMTSDEVAKAKRFESASSQEIYATNPEIRKVLDLLINGTFNSENYYYDLYQSLVFGDRSVSDTYMVVRDFESYAEVHRRIDREYRDVDTWNKKAILNVAKSGFFSSDRTINEYNDKIWHLKAYTGEELKAKAAASKVKKTVK
ncbi:MAG: glycogen/starch/alpha-glucan phosphorylase [Clostridia bacterium]|nr:glycogen/starch/alpha-glucan phosphorylase [Clostridia bacterium]